MWFRKNSWPLPGRQSGAASCNCPIQHRSSGSARDAGCQRYTPAASQSAGRSWGRPLGKALHSIPVAFELFRLRSWLKCPTWPPQSKCRATQPARRWCAPSLPSNLAPAEEDFLWGITLPWLLRAKRSSNDPNPHLQTLDGWLLELLRHLRRSAYCFHLRCLFAHFQKHRTHISLGPSSLNRSRPHGESNRDSRANGIPRTALLEAWAFRNRIWLPAPGRLSIAGRQTCAVLKAAFHVAAGVRCERVGPSLRRGLFVCAHAPMGPFLLEQS
jgi:hypothetical protein